MQLKFVIRKIKVATAKDGEGGKGYMTIWNDIYIYPWGSRIFSGSQDPERKVTVVVGIKGSRDRGVGSSPSNILYELFGGSRVGAGFKYRRLLQPRRPPM